MNIKDQSSSLKNLSPAKRALLLKMLGEEASRAEALKAIPRCSETGPAPLSAGQERLWFLTQLEPTSSVYNMAAAFHLHGAFSIAAFNHSLNQVIRRHDALRTTFADQQGRPVQVVHPFQPVFVAATTLAADEAADEAAASPLEQLVRQQASQPFDLERGPLLRVKLVRLAAEHHVLIVCMHHIISDGWSVGILLQEIERFYAAYLSGRPADLAELPIQYTDYARWQQQKGDEQEQQLAYWSQRLAGAPGLLEMPTDHARPAQRSHRGGRVSFELRREVIERLKKAGHEQGATLYMVLLAAFKVLLYRYTSQSDILVGTPVAGRSRSEVEGLIGFFVNTVVLRSDLSGEPSYRELLSRVKQGVLEGFGNQEAPFERVVERVQPERALSHSPLFQVMFSMAEGWRREVKLAGLEASEIEVGTGSAKFDLTMQVLEGEAGMKCAIEYSRDLFEAATIKRMIEHFKQLLDAIAADPDERISRLTILTPPEREWLVRLDEPQSYRRSACFHELFEAQVKQKPEAIAVAYEGERMSYAELNRRADCLARYLRRKSVGPETIVGICLQRGPQMIVGILAVLKSGGAYLPLDPSYPAERLAFMLEDAHARVVLTSEGMLDASLEPSVDAVFLDRDWELIEQADEQLPPVVTSPDNIAYIIYTSGSTGRPKGVMTAHSSMVGYLRWVNEGLLGEGTVPVIPTVTSLAFDMSLKQMLAPLLRGAEAWLIPADIVAEPAALVRQISARTNVSFNCVPSLWKALLEVIESDTSLLKADCLSEVIFGGEPLSRSLVDKTFSLLPQIKIRNIYGPTEATANASADEVQPEGQITIGRAVAGKRIYLLDSQLQPVPVGVAGELYIGGEGVARGYLNRPELTAEFFIPDPFGEAVGARLYKTGDVGRLLSDGRIEFIGRVDNQVKVRGFRIELGEIESALGSHPAVEECLVSVGDTAGGEKRLVAYVVLKPETKADGNELSGYLRQKLPDYMVPAVFMALDRMPLTATGKVDRRALPAADKIQGKMRSEFVAPRTSVEQTLASIWSRVLDIELVGIHDSFFELGGHSLLATRVMSQVRDAFQVEMPLRSLFESPTVASLSQRIEVEIEAGHGLQAPPILATQNQMDAPLSAGQERLWFLTQLEPTSSVYNMAAAFHLHGAFSIAAFNHSLNQVIRRHDALRTTFADQQGRPVQVVHPFQPVFVAATTLAADEVADEAAASPLEQLVRQQASQPFDLERGPLLRVKLVRLAAEHHVLVVCMHHIISDGWSVGILLQEIERFYAAYLSGRPADLAELPIQYTDYARWQQQKGDEQEQQLAYWSQRLAGAPGLLEMPTDHARPAQRSHRGGRVSFELRREVIERLKKAGHEQGATLYMVLLAAFKVLLYRYTSQSDILVGTPVAGRSRSEVEGLIGFFVNTVVLRSDLSGEPSYRELLGRVKQGVLEGFSNQEAPFERVVERVQPERALSHSPLFQVMFSMAEGWRREVKLAGLEASEIEVGTGSAKFDLTMQIGERDDEMRGSIEYNLDLFESSTIARMAAHFTQLLDSIAADPDQPISRLPMLTEAEQQQLLKAFNPTPTAYPQESCMHEMFEQQVRRTPEAIAVVCGNEQVSYAELNRRAERVASYLRRRGVGVEAKVGICTSRSINMVAGLLGVLKAGAAYVPLDPAYPLRRLQYVVKDAAVEVVLVEAATRQVLSESAVEAVCIEHLLQPQADQDAESAAPAKGRACAANLGYVIYTSGSTGQPKGIGISHRSAVAMISWATQTFSAAELSAVLASTSICFDLSVFEIFVPLSMGGKIVVVNNVLEVLSDAAAREVKLINTVPSAMAELVRLRGVPESVEVVNLAGEALSRKLVEGVYEQASVKAVWNLYGPSEDTTYSTYAKIGRGGAGEPVIGRGVANTRLYVVSREQELVALGVVGELCIAGAGLARGYEGRAAQTAERFVPNPWSEAEGERMYRTGDLVRWTEAGELEYLGRADHQVKVRGFRIELGEIESTLRQHPGVREAIVVASQDSAGDKRIVAYVVTRPDHPATSAELRTFIKDKLPDYMVPSAFVILDEFPLLPNGKVNRHALPAPESGADLLSTGYQPPRTPVEEILVNIWCETLGMVKVGIADNFFELGGHSLLAVRLVSRLRDALHVELPLRRLFERPTVAQLAEIIEQEMAAGRALQLPPIQAVSRDGKLPLSFSQQRLWFLCQLDPSSVAYNMPTALRLKGSLNIEALEWSISQIIARHETLRTRFVMVDGEPVQEIIEAKPVRLMVDDLSHLPEQEIEAEVRRLATEDARQPFDLEQGPLVRAKLLKLAAEHHVLVVCMHHIISDGWSVGILIQEIAALYDAKLTNKPEPLTALPIQYADYAQWQRQLIQEELLQEHLEYWQERLGGELPVLQLPTDHGRSSMQTQRGARAGFSITADLAQKLRAVCNEEAATLYMVLLAAFKVLLYRYTSQTDVLVGTPVAGRSRSEVEGLIGFFVNTVVLRSDLSGEPTYRELLGRVKQGVLEGFGNQEAPFERVVERVQPERALSHSPLFQVMFSMAEGWRREVKLAGLEASEIEVGTGSAKFDLTMQIGEGGGELRGSIEYNLDLFESSTIARMAAHFTQLLDSIAADLDQPISRLPMLTQAEQQRLLHAFNPTPSAYPQDRCMHEMFEQQVRRTPEAIAVVCGSEQVSYAELNRRAEHVATYLAKRGVGVEAKVGICTSRSSNMVAGLLGVLKAGAAYVPLDPAYPLRRLQYVVKDAAVEVVLVEAATREVLSDSQVEAVCIEQLLTAQADEDEESAAPAKGRVLAANLGYVIYTSGSTGQPKGIGISHRSAVAMISWATQTFSAAELSAVLASTSICFDLSVFEIFVPLSMGGKIVVVNNVLEVLSDAAAREVKLINTVPSAMAELVRLRGVPESVEGVNLAGEALSRKLVEGVYEQASVKAVWNLYGPSEDTTYSTYAKIGRGGAGEPVIGRGVANTRLYVVSREQELVALGVVGELCIAGAGLARGYEGRAAQTAERFVPNPWSEAEGERMYRTGDLVRWNEAGELEYLGRADHQVKVRGFRIELGEIEVVLAQHPAVREAAVLALSDKPGDTYLVAYVVGTQEQAFTPGDLRAFLKTRLPEHMVPSHFVELKDLPLTQNGKVDRRALPGLGQGLTESAEEFVAPRTSIEERLAGIWALTLNLERVGVHNSFFELGGHSLLATRVISKVRETFGVELPLRAIFESPTVAELAERIESESVNDPASQPGRISLAPRDGEMPLSFAQERVWFLDQMTPGSSAYNIPAAVRLKGRLNVEAMELALAEVVRRHEVLQTSFAEADGRPVQIISPELTIELPIIDLSEPREQDREALVHRLVAEEVQRPFELTRAPLMRARLIRLEEQEHVLVVTMHHIISDGWSVGILIREVAALYESVSTGRRHEMLDLPIQYADFAVWQRQRVSGELLDRQLAYWKARLENAPPVLQLPTDRPRPAVQVFQGAKQSIRLSESLTWSLNKLSQREGATLYMALLAAFKVLLYRYTSQSDILVGTPVAGRSRSEVEGLIGFFVNTVVLRSDLSGEPSYRELLERVKQNVLEGFANQEAPFERIVEQVQPERALSHSPLFQVMFNMLNLPTERIELSGLTVEGLSINEATSKFDITLYARESGQEIKLDLAYDASLFDQERMALMLEQFEHLLRQIAENPEESIAGYSLVTPSSEVLLPDPHLMLPSGNEETVHSRFAFQARRVPQKTAVVDKHGMWNYQELVAYSSQLAACLRANGVERHAVVAIYGHRRASLVAAMLGVLKAGAAFVILDPAYPATRLIDCLRLANPVGLIQIDSQSELPRALEEFLSQGSCRCRIALPLEPGAVRDLLADYPAEDSDVSVSADDLAYIAFTSGSTGMPKGIRGTHRPLSHFLRWQSDNFGLSESDRVSLLSGLSHDPLLRDIFTPLWLGATLSIPDPLEIASPGWLAKWMERETISVTHLTPALARLLMLTAEATEDADEAVTLSALRYAFFGGDLLTRRDVDQLQAIAPSVTCVNYYGTTETPQAMSYFIVPRESGEGSQESAGSKETIPLGQGIDGVQMLILSPSRQMAGVGEVGEIYVRTPYLTRGYVGDESLTQERFLINPFTEAQSDLIYRTGDLARYLPDGNVEYLGRMDDQVKLRGFRIELGEIETALAEHPDVKAAAVILTQDGPDGRQLAAYIVSNNGDIPASRLRGYLKERLPDYMLPSAFLSLELLPLTPNGKIDRRALPAAGAHRSEEVAYAPPTSEMERSIAAIWQATLGIERVGLHDNFFDLGGHSLLVVQVNSKLRKLLKRNIPVIDLFKYPTVNSLAAFLSQEQTRQPDFLSVQERAKKARQAISQQRAVRGKGRGL